MLIRAFLAACEFHNYYIQLFLPYNTLYICMKRRKFLLIHYVKIYKNWSGLLHFSLMLLSCCVGVFASQPLSFPKGKSNFSTLLQYSLAADNFEENSNTKHFWYSQALHSASRYCPIQELRHDFFFRFLQQIGCKYKDAQRSAGATKFENQKSVC